MDNNVTNNADKKNNIKHWHAITGLLVFYDIIAAIVAYGSALWFRFDCKFSDIPQEYLMPYIHFIPIYILFYVAVFTAFKLYQSIWRFASYNELSNLVWANVITGVFHITVITIFYKRMPLSYYSFGAVMQFLLTVFIRFSYRFVILLRGVKESTRGVTNGSRVMLIGAGNAGQIILRDIMSARETADRVVCIIDDNPNKWNRYMNGVPIVGGSELILESVEKYGIDKIYIAIPSATARQKRDILNICKETGCEIKNLPGIYQMVNGEVSISKMKPVEVEDLLGRDQIKVDLDEIFSYLKDKTILVTGGGGSIGSELCRQIAGHNPRRLIVFDIYENNAYEIQQELKKKYPELDLVTIIGSVRDSRKIYQVFEEYKPQVVYHAAAHKHVPLMEESPCEAIKNNVIGTYKTAYAALMNGCERFVLISTDKAVNPTNIMGASKRICEMVIQSFDRLVKENRATEIPRLFIHEEHEVDASTAGRTPGETKIELLEGNTPAPAEHELHEGKTPAHTDFVAVRFGNVLGSNGSVIPLFKKQIEAGGPVTVTHPDIIRYFMTIPEAVSLVLQAGVYAEGGEIFVLDMGDPVRIDDLARNLIKLSGYKPDVDIKVEYIGLRPGEKLFEEKLMAEEGLRKTKNELIHIGSPVSFDVDEFLKEMRILMEAAYENCEDIRDIVQGIVKTYKVL